MACRMAMGPGQRRKLSASPEDQLEEWNEGDQAHVGAKVEHGFRIMRQQFGFERTECVVWIRIRARC